MTGWIKIYRKLLEWEWYKNHNVKMVFLHLLLNASHKHFSYCGVQLNPGQIITGRLKLAKELNLTQMQIRTALNKLKSTNEITIKTTKQYSIISINNWNEYQDCNQQIIQQVTNKQPTNSQQITTKQEYKNVKNVRNKISSDFENFYSIYPRKEARNSALKAYEKALKDGALPEIILDGVKRYNDQIMINKVESRFIKMPATWLNQGCWDDNYTTANPADAEMDERYKQAKARCEDGQS